MAPGDDFYKYVNASWDHSVHIPPFLSSYGVSEELEASINKSLFSILRRCTARAAAGKPVVAGSVAAVEDAVGRLVMSAIRPEKQRFSVEYLKRGVTSLGCIRNQTDVVQTLGSLCRFKVGTILEISFSKVHVTAKEVDTYLNLAPGTLGLPDISYYNATAPGKTRVLYGYTKLLQRLSGALGVRDLADGVTTESRFVGDLTAAKREQRDVAELYSAAELQRAYPKILWQALFEAYGLDAKALAEITIRVESPRWIRFLESRLTDLPLEQWYALFSIHTILHALAYLPHPFDQWHFEFFERQLRGVKAVLPQADLALQIVKTKMSRGLSYLFVREHLTPALKAEATEFAEKLLRAAAARMASVPFLGAAARRRAAEKIRQMHLSVGFVESGAPPVYPSLQTDTLVSNLYLLDATETDAEIAHLRKRINPEKEWFEPAFSVNAYYYHELNQLVLPAASCMWPFWKGVGSAKDTAWSFGGLGVVLAHEITHAFDKEGKEYDERGVAGSRWWSPTDTRAYEHRTKELVRLFSQAKVEGRAVDGALTLNENIADLGGLAIALDALKAEIRERGWESEAAALYREFFISYATSWRTKETRYRRLQRLYLDVHAPVELRVNLIVCHFQEWYDAFGVRTTDELYIPPEERIRMF